jgi:class 3 adenylate cyclase
VLVSSAVAAAIDGAGIELQSIGDIGLRGVAEPVALYRASIRHSSPSG